MQPHETRRNPDAALLTIPQVCTALGVGEKAVRQWINRKVDPLPAVRLPGFRGVRIRKSDLDTWVDSLKPFNVEV